MKRSARMQMLNAVAVPLITSSIITGAAALKPTENGKVADVALSYIITTNVIGAILGTLFAVVIRPGIRDTGAPATNVTVNTVNLQTADMFADLIR